MDCESGGLLESWIWVRVKAGRERLDERVEERGARGGRRTKLTRRLAPWSVLEGLEYAVQKQESDEKELAGRE